LAGCVDQTRLSVHANVRLHPKVPLVAFFGLVHLWVALTFVVLGGTGRRNQGGIYDRAGFEHQAFGAQGVSGHIGTGGILIPSALVSSLRAVAQPSLFDSTTTGLPTRLGLNTRSQETWKLLPSTSAYMGLWFQQMLKAV
jgi:hypothetical protein